MATRTNKNGNHAGKKGDYITQKNRAKNPSGKPPFNPTQITQTFASRLRQVRDNMQMTQEDMAKILGVNLQTYGSYERGEANVTIERLREIATRTGKTPVWFLDEIKIKDEKENELLAMLVQLNEEQKSYAKTFIHTFVEKNLRERESSV